MKRIWAPDPSAYSLNILNCLMHLGLSFFISVIGESESTHGALERQNEIVNQRVLCRHRGVLSTRVMQNENHRGAEIQSSAKVSPMLSRKNEKQRIRRVIFFVFISAPLKKDLMPSPSPFLKNHSATGEERSSWPYLPSLTPIICLSGPNDLLSISFFIFFLRISEQALFFYQLPDVHNSSTETSEMSMESPLW